MKFSKATYKGLSGHSTCASWGVLLHAAVWLSLHTTVLILLLSSYSLGLGLMVKLYGHFLFSVKVRSSQRGAKITFKA